MTKFHAVGIDLGTTYSVVARLDDSGKTQIVRNIHGDILTPSVVLFDDKEVIVGKEAKKAAASESDRVAECVKRDMGKEFFSHPIRGEKLPPEVIQACILRKLASDATRICGPDIKVVITVPAYFDEPRRKATADSGEMAGLDVLDIVNEPTAAALAFGEHLGYLDPKGTSKGQIKVLVYDLGGGTFDVTLIDMKPGDIRTLATDGDVQLGGRDWDARLSDYLAEQFMAEHGVDPRQDTSSATRLMRAVEEAKHTLTARTVANVHLDFKGKSADLSVTRDAFEERTEDLLERTAYTTRQVLQAAGTSWQYVSHILLVGGSTRMPMVSKLLERVSGMKPEHVVNADEAVARGAAIYAGYLLNTREPSADPAKAVTFKVTDVNAHSLGIEGIDQETMRKQNIVIIPRNTPLPFKAQERFVTKTAGQQSVVVQVLEGESKAPEQCTRIARAVVRQLPQGLPKNYPIEVAYEYGTNSRLKVHAKLPGTSKDVQIELEREGSMKGQQVAQWKKVVSTEKGFNAFEEMLQEVLMDEPEEDEREKSIFKPTARPIPVNAASSIDDDSLPDNVVPLTGAGKKPGPKIEVKPLKAFIGDKPTTAESTNVEAAANAAMNALMQSAGLKPMPTMGGSQGRISETPILERSSFVGSIINLVGHIIAPLLGIAIGYYVLCWLKPEANVLQLQLPGLPPPAASTPKEPAPPSPAPPPSR